MNKHTRRRLKENEVIFRKANKEVADFVEDETGSGEVIVPFYCECSQATCRRRINLTTAKYKELHNNKNQFIALAGHETPKVEKIVQKLGGYYVLEKFGELPSAEAIDLALPNAAPR